MTPHIDDPPVDVPPPPYSETDIYSNSAGRSPILGQSQTLPIRQRTSSHNSLNVHDDASSATSNSEVIYTPPLTPHSSPSNIQPFRSPNPAGSNDGFLSPGYRNNLQNCASVASDHITSASAEAYFESRPVAAGVDLSRELHHVITIRPGSSPMDFSYQQKWATRDIRLDDWHTFLNYLLPNYAGESNENLIDRKLRAEGIENDAESRSAQSEKDGKPAANTSPVVAQLEQIRLEEQPGQSSSETVREWNEGFFAPRGMTIHLEQTSSAQDEPRMPGSWDQSFNNASPSPEQQQTGSGGRWWQSLPRFESSNGRLRVGGVSIDNDRISIGDRFVADSRGLRIGGLVADDRGLSLHGRDLFGGTSQRARGQPPAPLSSAPPGPSYGHPPIPPMPSMPPMPPMPMAPGYGFSHPGPPPGFAFEDRADHRPHHQSDDCGRGRGYSRQGISRHRSSSSASSSSSSSSSSSDSNDSIGSLPDYDDLKDSQIPVTRSYLQDWLSHPENAITRATVKEANENIKAAKQQSRNAAAVVISTSERKEVHAMLGQWERVKRQQKSTRKQLRKERRAARRAEKRERRQTRREARQSRREAKREGREARREARRERRGGGSRHRGRSGGCHDRGSGPTHPHHRPGFGRGPGHFGGGGGGGSHGLFGGHQGFPGAGFGPGARRGGGAFSFEGGRGGAFPPPVAHGPWSHMMHSRPWNNPVQGANEWPQRFPGAWPGDADVIGQDAHEHERGDRDTSIERDSKVPDDPYAVSASMYRELDAKRALLQEKRSNLSASMEDQAQIGSDKRSELAEKSGASALVEQIAELEELERAVDKLSVDADEQYAKEILKLDELRNSIYAGN